jgi:hypothetical protein
VAAEARLDDLLQCKSALEASQAVAREHAERQLPTFARASQNVVATTALLDALSAPSTDGVGEVYEWLKSILGATATQQAESFLLYRVKAPILLPADSKDGGQMATQGAPDTGMTSSLEGFLTCDHPGRPSARSEPQTYRRHRPRNDGAQSQQHAWNLHCKGCDNHEGRSLGPKGSCPKVFGGTMRNAHFPRRFRVSDNVAKYDEKTNPNVWLEDYRLTCRAGGANDDLYMI